jgi:hypothetical protein
MAYRCEISCLQGGCAPKDALIFADGMVTPSVNRFWQFIAVSLQLHEGYVA